MGNNIISVESTAVEATSVTSRTRTAIRRPLSDCTNTIDTSTPSQSSSSSTKNSSSVLKPTNLSAARASVAANPGKTLVDQATGSGASASGRSDHKAAKSIADSVPLFSTPSRTPKPSVPEGRASDEAFQPSSVVRRQSADKRKRKEKEISVPKSCLPGLKTRSKSNLSAARSSVAANPDKTLVDQATGSGASASGRGDDKVAKSIADSVPLFSTPSRTLKPSVPEGRASDEAFQPSSVYIRRQSADKRKMKEKEISVPKSCLPDLKTRSKREKMNEDGVSKSCPAPNRKKQRVAVHSLPQDFIEQQKAYFAEVDAFQLSEEEVDELSD